MEANKARLNRRLMYIQSDDYVYVYDYVHLRHINTIHK